MKDVRVVILAGGKGTRLRPYTAVFPKPLIPIGDMPILEVVLRQLKSFGFRKITISVNHLADLLGRTSPVTGELHTFVTDLGHLRDGAWKIRLALVADGIHFETDGNFLLSEPAVFGRRATGQTQRRAREAERGELDELTAGN